jgi:hypothetical protein
MSVFVKQGGSARRFLADRLDHLQQTIDQLGQRLRSALASVVGDSVSEAVHSALRSLLTGMPPLDPEYDPYARYSGDPYAPARQDPYAEEYGWERSQSPTSAPTTTPAEPPVRWRLALAAALQVLAFWLRDHAGRQAVLSAVGVAAATGGAAFLAGPLFASGAAVVGAAVSLLGLVDGAHNWVTRMLQATVL